MGKKSNYTITTKTEQFPTVGQPDLYAADPATAADLARLEAMIADEEEKAAECEAHIKSLEEEHGIDSLKESRKMHKEAAQEIIVKLRAAVKAGAPE